MSPFLSQFPIRPVLPKVVGIAIAVTYVLGIAIMTYIFCQWLIGGIHLFRKKDDLFMHIELIVLLALVFPIYAILTWFSGKTVMVGARFARLAGSMLEVGEVECRVVKEGRTLYQFSTSNVATSRQHKVLIIKGVLRRTQNLPLWVFALKDREELLSSDLIRPAS